MEWTPLPLADFILLHVGDVARPAALLGALALVMLAGGIAGSLSSPFLRLPVAGLGAAAGFLAVVFLVLFAPATPVPGISFVAAYLLVLATFSASRSRVRGRLLEARDFVGLDRGAVSGRLGEEGHRGEGGGTLLRGAALPAGQRSTNPRHTRWPVNHSRRSFLLRSGTILGGAALLLAIFSIRPLITALGTRRLFRYQPPRGLPVAGLADLVTAQDRFYVMDKLLQYPDVGPPDWRLQIDGAVTSTLSLDFSDLLSRPAQHRYVTMECVDNPVGGPLMGNALWTGVLLADLLKQAEASGDFLLLHSADNYLEVVPRQEVEARGALVAYAMNGELLSRAHGYPARLVLPGLYGFKSVKWLTRLEVTHIGGTGDWRSHGWTERAIVHTATRIDVARRTGDAVLLAGIAYGGSRGIKAVQVRVNGGPWRRAQLGPSISPDSWVQWLVRIRSPQTLRVEARAIDGEGRVQTGRHHDAYPNGSTGWPSVTV